MLVSPENLCVHIKTQEEACEVVEWFESFGYHREALTPFLYLQYPFIHIGSHHRVLTGSSVGGLKGYTEMEYEEWEALVNEELDSGDPIDEDAFAKILNSNWG